MIEVNKIINKDCIKGMKELPDNCIDCCVTSPPYFGLRDYGHIWQIGLEDTIERYVLKMVEVFAEVYRVLKPTGTLWLNLGDSYAGSCKGIGDTKTTNKGNNGSREGKFIKVNTGLKDKDQMFIPHEVAKALRTFGYYARDTIIWHKPNPMPESVRDRTTKSHEYIFLMSKSAKYYYDADAIKTPIMDSSIQRLTQDIDNQKGSDRVPGKTNGRMKAVGQFVGGNKHKNLDLPNAYTIHKTRNSNGQEWQTDGWANKRSVWTVTTKPYSEAHFATYPEDLIVDMIKAGCPECGIVLDPFMGAGTTAVVCKKLNRNYLGFELNPKYISIAEKRLYNEIGMFL